MLPKGRCLAEHLKRATVWGAERDSSVTGLHSFWCSFTTYSSDCHSPRKRQWKLQMFLSLRASYPGLWSPGTSACSRAAFIQHRGRSKHGAATKAAHTAHWNTSDIAQVGSPHFYMEREASTGKVICKKEGCIKNTARSGHPAQLCLYILPAFEPIQLFPFIMSALNLAQQPSFKKFLQLFLSLEVLVIFNFIFQLTKVTFFEEYLKWLKGRPCPLLTLLNLLLSFGKYACSHLTTSQPNHREVTALIRYGKSSANQPT